MESETAPAVSCAEPGCVALSVKGHDRCAVHVVATHAAAHHVGATCRRCGKAIRATEYVDVLQLKTGSIQHWHCTRKGDDVH